MDNPFEGDKVANTSLSQLITGGSPLPPPPVPETSGPTTDTATATPPDADYNPEIGKALYSNALSNMTAYKDPTLIDVGRGLGNAPGHLAYNLGAFATDVASPVLSPITGLSPDELSPPDFEAFGHTTTLVGGLAQGFSEFAMGMYLSGGVLKASGLAPKLQALKYGKAALGTAEGALTDFTAFRSHNARMSDLLYNLKDKYPQLDNPLTRFLKSDESDNWFEGRLKNVLEGAGLGYATSVIFKSLKMFRTVKAVEATHGADAAAKLWAEQAEKLKPEMDAVMAGNADLIGITEAHAKDILIRTGGITPVQADSAITGLKAIANEKGVDLMSLLKDEIQGFRSRTESGYNAERLAASEAESSIAKSVAHGQARADFEMQQAAAEHQAQGADAAANSEIPNASADLQARNEKAAFDARNPPSDAATPSQLRQTVDALPNHKLTPTEVQSAVGGSNNLQTNQLFQTMQADPAVHGGVTDFLNTGKAMVTLFENANGKTFIHEVSHILRRYLPEDEMSLVADAFGVRDAGNWTREEEEKFANAVTDKVLTGKSTDPKIDYILDKTGKNVTGIYRQLASSPGGVKPNPDLQSFMDGGNKQVQEISDKPTVAVDDVELARAGKAIADAMNKGADYSKAIEDNGVNLFNVNASDDVLKLFGTMSDYAEKYVNPHLSKVESLDSVVFNGNALAYDIGTNSTQAIASLQSLSKGTKDLSTRLFAARSLITTVVSDFRDVAQLASQNRTPENAVKVLQSWGLVKRSMAMFRESQQNVARGLGSFRAKVGPLDNTVLLERLANEGGPQKVWDMVDEALRVDAITPPAEKTAALRKLVEPNKWIAALQTLRMNAMLGNTTTLGAITISKAAQTLLMPFEKALASGVAFDMDGVREGVSYYKALAGQVITSWKAAAAAFRVNSSIIDAPLESRPNPISAAAFGQEGTGTGAALDLMGTVTGIFPRLHMANSEFFKTLNYRAFMQVGLEKEAWQALGKEATQEAIDAYVQNGFRDAFDAAGNGTSKPAMDYAREAAFDSKLTGFAGRASGLINSNPVLKFILPFHKISTNLFLNTVSHTPLLGALLSSQHTALSKGLASPEARLVLAKWAVGGSAMAAFYTMADGGYLTGKGASDKKTQDQMRLSGWQPYSFAYDGQDGSKHYVAYNRIEPWGSLLGLMADYHELAPHMEDQDVSKSALAIMSAVARNVTNKTYMKGLADFVDAASNPDQKMANYVQAAATSFFPSTLSAFNNDPYVREASNSLDAIRARIPGYSETVSPKRNILGEPVRVPQRALLPDAISPFVFSQSVSDPAKVELASLSRGLQPPDPTKYGVDYRNFTNQNGQTAYDRWQELTGQIRSGSGQTLTQAINSIVGTRAYQGVVKSGDKGMPYRITAMSKLLNDYRSQAEEQMLREYPQLANTIRGNRIKQSSDLVKTLQSFQVQQPAVQ